MQPRAELLGATDQQIDEAVTHADPMILRGLVFQLAGDESVVHFKVEKVLFGFVTVATLSNPEEIAQVRAKAAAFLKSYRDAGAPAIALEVNRHLYNSISLTVGDDVPTSECEMWVEQLALNPWARAATRRLEAGHTSDFVVAVIGAGMGGLNAAVQLRQANIPFYVLEKNADVGGTWYENRYPGARVDSPSRTYTHIYGVNFECPYPYGPRSENLRYFSWVADTFGVRDAITFNTEVSSITWDDVAKKWEITARGREGDRKYSANAIITSVGFLSRPQVPAIDGLETFAGSAFHTARWPEGLDVTGKRVAVVGTGASGYQLVPELARQAGHVYVFQRTPSWCFDFPGYLDPFPEEMQWLDRNFPFIKNFTRLRLSYVAGPRNFAEALRIDPNFEDPHARSAFNKKVRDERVGFIADKLKSKPELIQKMTPRAPPLSARWVLVDRNYSVYDALLRDNVTLIINPIDSIGPKEISLEAGDKVPVDVIVFATGFKANDFLWPMEVRGRDGTRIEQLWSRDGARAYVGTMLPGFPNFFMVYGPNTNNFGGLQIVDFEELVTRFALNCISELIVEGKQTVEVSNEAYWRFNKELDRCESKMLYSDPRANSYYKNAFGRSSANSPIDIRRIWRWLRGPVAGPRTSGASPDEDDPAESAVQARFGEDLMVE